MTNKTSDTPYPQGKSREDLEALGWRQKMGGCLDPNNTFYHGFPLPDYSPAQTSDRHKSTLRGHKIELHNAVWIYPDTKEYCSARRECGFCGKGDTPEGHDGCLGTLDGVMNACCGHGVTNDAYVQFQDRGRLDGQEALDFINKEQTK